MVLLKEMEMTVNCDIKMEFDNGNLAAIDFSTEREYLLEVEFSGGSCYSYDIANIDNLGVPIGIEGAVRMMAVMISGVTGQSPSQFFAQHIKGKCEYRRIL